MALKGESYTKLYQFYHSLGKHETYNVPREREGIITILDSDYPDPLRKLYKPPMVLFYRGNTSLLYHSRKVAIVGTRKATSYGVSVAERLSTLLAENNVAVISGLARGIDIAAHRNIIDRGLAIAVLGNGLDIFYPFKNRQYQEMIAEYGLLISEYPPDMRGSKWTYVARNRIIAALSDLVIVVESPLKGGSIHTAEFAIDLGIPVAAVPGDIFRRSSQGCNRLIADGALVITEPSDVLLIIGVNRRNIQEYKLVKLLKELGGKANISKLLQYYDDTGLLMKEIVTLDNKNIVKMEGSVVVLIE